MVSTARAWLPAGHAWPQAVNAGTGAPADDPAGTGPSAGSPIEPSPAGPGAAADRSRLAGAGQDRSPPGPEAEGPEIRKRVADGLGALAALVDPALTAAVRRARQAWDQADALVVFDDQSLAQVAALRRWLLARAGGTPGQAAAGALEGLLALDGAMALIRLFERRLAALLRLQLRSPEPELLPRGRPFLDLAAALREAEQAWR